MSEFLGFAWELLAKVGSLDGVYAHLEDASIRPNLREKLENGRDKAYLSYELATIVPEAPIDFAPEDALIKPYHAGLEMISFTFTYRSISCKLSRSPVTMTHCQALLEQIFPTVPITSSASQPWHS